MNRTNRTLFAVAIVMAFNGCLLPKVARPLPGELKDLTSDVRQASSTQKDTINRAATTRELDAKYELVKEDIKAAMAFANYGQRRDFKFRKKVGTTGVLFGVAATALNAASPANIVLSTVFTGLQTSTLGYISNTEGLVDPFSNESLGDSKKTIRDLHTKYTAKRAELNNTALTDAEYSVKLGAAIQLLQDMNFECAAVLSLDSGEKKFLDKLF